MQYDLQKLERMTLEQVREIAQEMGLKPRRSQSIREISYAILDAQADKRAADVQAKEEARAASGKTGKRERVRGVKLGAKKVDTTGMKSERVVATVGTEREQMAQIETTAAPHKPTKTIVAVNPMAAEPEKVESGKPKVESEQPVVETPKKKRGRPKKAESAKPAEAPEAPKQEVAEAPKPEAPKPVEKPAEKPTENPKPTMRDGYLGVHTGRLRILAFGGL